jgi:hypothetical protein
MYLHDVGIQIYNKFVKMGLGTKISFDELFVELQIDENIYLFALQCTIHKPTLFFKHKPNDIRTNIFSIYVGTLWEANNNAQFIFDPYADVAYYIFYLTKIDKYVTQKM